MDGIRVIISDAGQGKHEGYLREELAKCGGEVAHSYRLIRGVAAGMSPEALRRFFSLHPEARAFTDRQRQIPPIPFGRDEWAEVTGPRAHIPTTYTDPELSPLALSLMRVEEVLKLGIDGSGIRVCVVDSGIDFNHPDLQGTAILGPDGMPLAADFTETDLTDTVGHGTAVAGCIASQARQIYTITDETTGKVAGYTRIKGVAPGVRFMSAKVFDTRVASGYDSAIIAALEWAAANGAHLINMSLGGQSLPNDGLDPLAAAVTALAEKGILVTVSAGNEGGGQGTLKSPGSSAGAITVGASTMYRSFAELGFLAEPQKWTSDQVASFSSLGPASDGRIKPDILAPGAFDWGLAPAQGSEEGQHFQLFGGTSQAAPLAAGAIALVMQAYHKQNGRYPTRPEVLEILGATAEDLGLPANMQGAGRIDALRAVQAALGEEALVTATALSPVHVSPGEAGEALVEICNRGATPAQVEINSRVLAAVAEWEELLQGEISNASSPLELEFTVAPETHAIRVSLDWTSEEHGPRSPRLMVAVYDPEGRFVNYQRPNSSGDLELGKSVDTWISRPAPGRWSARIFLRLGEPLAVQPFTLAVRAYRAIPWAWVQVDRSKVEVAPGKSVRAKVGIHVPEGTPAGSHAGHLIIGKAALPISVVVPMELERGRAVFTGDFQHGYQGSWGNGDWYYHNLKVPEGTRSVIATVQWPDVDNALECYLIDPNGHAVMGRSNNEDIWDDGDSDHRGGQMILADPKPGQWQVAVHSFAFSGRGVPEPYNGLVETAGELVTPHRVTVETGRGADAPVAILVRNPGKMPLTVTATIQSEEVGLTWHSLSAECKSGVDPEGKAAGAGHQVLATVDVPLGARQVGISLTWEPTEAELSVSLFDPVAQGDRATVAGNAGKAMLLESDPLPGPWTLMAGVTAPEVGQETVRVRGAAFVVAPRRLEGAECIPVTIQPGATGFLPVTIRGSLQQGEVRGRIRVTSTEGDQLGEVQIALQVTP